MHRNKATAVSSFERLKNSARRLKQDVVAIWFLARDPECPLALRALALAIAAYALSPIDLIPDFIPVLGLLDDLLLIPLGLWLVLRLAPPELLERARIRADELSERPRSLMAACLIGLLWLGGLLAALLWLHRKWP